MPTNNKMLAKHAAMVASMTDAERATAAKRTVTEVCEKCKTEFQRPPGRRRRVCLECAMAGELDVIEQLRARRGPAYEKWKRNIKAAADRL